MSRKPRHPSLEEMRLWHQVARTVTPIGRSVPDTEPQTTNAAATPAKPVTTPPAPLKRGSQAPPRAPQPGVIDRRLSGRVARGRLAIDARIDLHGMTQAAAHRRLGSFLHDTQASGSRLALIITGKGRTATGRDVAGERGVLRRMVPQWLGSAELRPFVVGFGEAGRQHGGAGALYVHIRHRRGH
ncbi:MAG: Smr/MutS family protein [Alphaproteobacteria bacterium]